MRYPIDLSVFFYDLTALVLRGDYPDSDLADYGFAHNTPSDTQKVKLGLLATADGGLPCLFQPWSGRTADTATLQQNMEALRALLQQHGLCLPAGASWSVSRRFTSSKWKPGMAVGCAVSARSHPSSATG